MSDSLAALLRHLPEPDRLRFLASLPDEDLAALRYEWAAWARDNQHPPPGAWTIWLLLAGRGFGKSRTGAEWVREQVRSGRARRLALMGRTVADVRDVMVEGESGLLAISPPGERPRYEPSKRRLTWPNGAQATTYSADEPDSLRGPQHDGGWADELAAWDHAEAWSNFLFGLRLGQAPQVVVTTTPKPVPLLKDLLRRPGVIVTRGSTYENLPNLAPTFIEQVVQPYEGTRLGRQELDAELLEDVEGALWQRGPMIEAHRVTSAPHLVRIVVAIDPATTTNGNETGIGVAGIDNQRPPHGYVLTDRSGHYSPDTWARRALDAYEEYAADRIVAESNQGGEMVRHTLQTVDRAVAVTLVHARRGKFLRAEPVAALYEQGRIHHVGPFPALEDQLCGWVPGDDSPDRLDWLVWAFTDLIVGHVPSAPAKAGGSRPQLHGNPYTAPPGNPLGGGPGSPFGRR